MRLQLIILPGGASMIAPVGMELSERQIREMAEMLAGRRAESLPLVISTPLEIIDLREPKS